MIRRTLVLTGLIGTALLFAPGAARSEDKPLPPQFKYAGGTEDFPEGCDGNLEMNPQVMTFRCWKGPIEVPYSDIEEMHYRVDVPKSIRKMKKIKWKVPPPANNAILKPKRNRYFTVLYRADGERHIMVLEVRPNSLRPYLAELDLRTDKRVDVQPHDESIN